MDFERARLPWVLAQAIFLHVHHTGSPQLESSQAVYNVSITWCWLSRLFSSRSLEP